MLTIDSLTVAYATINALQDVSLSVSPGEIMALIGPNGAGKTSLIRAVSGVKSVKKGKILYDGGNLLNFSIGERARVLAVVPQVRQLGGAFSVKQAVMMGRTAHMSWLGKAGEKDEAAVEVALAQTNLLDFAGRQIASLSGGEQQRVLLARALAQATPVLLLDEPTNHLDLQHQINLLRLVKTLTREKNLIVSMAIHDLNLVSFFADRVALLVDGRLHRLGSPEDVMRASYIQEAYQTPVEVIAHPQTGAPIIFPTNTLP